MKFPQDFIERVRESNNLVDIVGQYVQLRRTGGNHQGLCPFHNEKSPSFSVSEDKQVYHCFGCKASGNVFTFVQNYQGMTFPEAIEYLARRAGLALPEVKSEVEIARRDQKLTLYRINGLAAEFYHQQLKRLPTAHPVRQYLETRGLNEELVDRFKLGYAPEGWSELERYFASKRVPVSAAEQLGLLKRRTGGKNGHYDLFRHRLMFPIYSPLQQCLGFGGRVLSKDQQPKYLNSPDSEIFHKGKVFYGLNHSVKYIREADELIVVEGYMDWLALAKVSINNVVATLGTALTADHARMVKRYTDKVLLLFDGDEAGKNAARRSLPILLAEGVLTRGLFLPDELDPDEFVQERGEPALRTLIAGAPDLFDLVAGELWAQAKSSPTGKVRFLDEMASVLAAVQDTRLRALYSQSLAQLADVDVRLVQQSVSKALGGASGAGSRPMLKPPATAQAPRPAAKAAPEPARFELMKVPRAELELLNVILMKEVYLKEALKSGVGEQFTHPGAKAVFARVAEAYRQMPNKFDSLSALLVGEVQPVQAITLHLSEMFTSLSDEAGGKLLQDCITRVKESHLRLQAKELAKDLKRSGSANHTDQLEQIMNIQKNRRSLNRDS